MCTPSDTPLRTQYHRALSANRAAIGILQEVPYIHPPHSHAATHTLQHTATHTATYCNTHTAARNATLQHTHGATYCNTIPCASPLITATHCNTLQHTATQYHTRHHELLPPSCQEFAAYLLQHAATHCNTATHGNTLQHTATHTCNMQDTLADTWVAARSARDADTSESRHRRQVQVSGTL